MNDGSESRLEIGESERGGLLLDFSGVVNDEMSIFLFVLSFGALLGG